MAILARANVDNVNRGIVLMLVAWALFACVDTSVKWLLLAGLHPFQLAFMRYAGHFVIASADVLRSGFSRDSFSTSHFGLVMLRGVLLVLSTLFNFIALQYVPLTLTAAIMFSSPILVCILAWPLLGEKVGPWRWVAIVLGFIGVLIVVRPFSESFHWAALLSAFNALALALYSILTRKLSGQVATATMQFYMGALGTVVLLPLAAAHWHMPATLLDWVLLFGLGFFGWAGHELLTRAHGYATANTLMPYTYSFLIYLTISSYLVFAHIPDVRTMLGAAVVIASGLIIWKRAQIREVEQ